MEAKQYKENKSMTKSSLKTIRVLKPKTNWNPNYKQNDPQLNINEFKTNSKIETFWNPKSKKSPIRFDGNTNQRRSREQQRS